MTSPHRARFVIASAASALLVLAAPYIGVARAQFRAAFPGRFGLIVNILLAMTLAAAGVAALARIRERRWPRYAMLLLAGVLGIVFAHYNAVGLPDSIVVERFHFVEYGVITWLFYRAWHPRGDSSALVLAALMAFLTGIADEGLQWFVPGRYGEWRDIFLNGEAILCGGLFSCAVAPVPSFTRAWSPGSLRRVAIVGSLVLFALAVFVDVVHVGLVVSDSDGSAFLSRYSATELDGLARERARRWMTDPPNPSPPLLSREDQYRTEALWHVQARNEAWTRGDYNTAWRENTMLERHFSPVLDLGHRWPPPQRAAAQARDSGSPAAFFSTANRYPLYPWNRPAFRLVVVIVVGLFALTCLFFARRSVSSGARAAGQVATRP